VQRELHGVPDRNVTFQPPHINLPASAKILDAQLLYSANFDLEMAGTQTFRAIDLTEPAAPTTGMGYWTWANHRMQFELPARENGLIDYTDAVRLAVTSNVPLPAFIYEIHAARSLTGSGNAITAGLNSVTVDNRDLKLINSAGTYSFYVTYEAAVPEPATGGLAAFCAVALVIRTIATRRLIV
jgi:hypothetical protein